jgi:hypothetical protein
MKLLLTLDTDVLELLQSAARQRGVSLDAAANRALKLGLKAMLRDESGPPPYVTPSTHLGQCSLANVDDISSVLAYAEGEDYP